MPCRAKNAEPVFAANHGKVRLSIASIPERTHEVLESSGRSDRTRYQCPVEVRSDRNAFDAQSLHQMVDVPDHVADRRIGFVAAVRAQHGHREIQPDKSLAFTDRVELPVRQIARNRGDRMGIGMAGDQRLVADFARRPKTLFQ